MGSSIRRLPRHYGGSAVIGAPVSGAGWKTASSALLNPGAGSFTFSWIGRHASQLSNGVTKTVVQYNDADYQHGWMISLISTGAFNIYMMSGSGIASFPTAYVDGDWHVYALALDSVARTLTLWRDAVSLGTVSGVTFSAMSDGALSIGASTQFASSAGGSMADVVYDVGHSWSAAQVLEHFRTGAPPTASHRWPLDDGAGTTARNTATPALPLTAVSTASFSADSPSVARGAVRNLMPSSEDVTGWAKTAASTPAYGGALPGGVGVAAAQVLTADGTNNVHYLSLNIPRASDLSGLRLVWSCYVKKVSGSGWVAVGGSSGNAYAFFDLNTPAQGATIVASVPGFEDAGGGWYRVWITYYATSLLSTQNMMTLYLASGNAGLSFTGTDQVAFTGEMLEIAAPNQTTPSKYVATGAAPLSVCGKRDYRQNYHKFSDDLTRAEHVKNTGVVIVSGSLDVPAPSDAPTASVQKWTYDGSGAAGDYRLYSNIAAPEAVYRNGVPYAWAMWMRVASGSLPLRVQVCTNVQAVTVTSAWQRFLVLATGNGASGIQPTIFSAAANNAAFTLYTAGIQIVQGSSMPDYVKTNGAPANSSGAPRSATS